MAFKRGALLARVESAALKRDEDQKQLEDFQVGDTVDVHQWILEGYDKEGNEKRRIQIYSGTVISMKGGSNREMFTVRRLVDGQGVERTFPYHSPKIAKVIVKRTGRVRRAKLFYLRDRVGKATRLRERKKGVVVESVSTSDTGSGESKSAGAKKATKKAQPATA
jgi:large subunit ribosomal protein L19